MPSNIRLIDVSSGSTVSYYLSGPGTPYSGSGTPWTVQSTSPIQLSMNDKTGQYYTPQAPPRIEVYGGGPPFLIGSDLVSRGYGNVEEEFGLQIKATSHDNAVNVLRLLRRVLGLSTYNLPAILGIDPNNGTSEVFFQVYGGTIQESPSFINDEAGTTVQLIRATVRWVRSPFGTRASTGETLINAVTMGNNGTGSPDNVEVMSAGTGEMTNEGSPLNVALRGTTNANDTHFFVSILSERAYTAPGAAAVTSSTSGTTLTTITRVYSQFLTSKRKPRVLLRYTSPSANLETRILVYTGSVAGALLYTSPWVAATGGATAPGATLLDMGTWADQIRNTTAVFSLVSSGTYSIAIQIRSTTGAATSGTLAAVEFLDYYTFCEVIGTDSTGGASIAMYISTFRERSGYVTNPIPPISYGYDAGNLQLYPFNAIRGTAPQYVAGSSLWIAQLDSVNYDTTTGRSIVATVTHAPMFQTLRGNG